MGMPLSAVAHSSRTRRAQLDCTNGKFRETASLGDAERMAATVAEGAAGATRRSKRAAIKHQASAEAFVRQLLRHRGAYGCLLQQPSKNCVIPSSSRSRDERSPSLLRHALRAQLLPPLRHSLFLPLRQHVPLTPFVVIRNWSTRLGCAPTQRPNKKKF